MRYPINNINNRGGDRTFEVLLKRMKEITE